MPLMVRGASYRPVVLPELKDAVYFGQQKVFSDAQVDASPALREAIKSGTLQTQGSTLPSRAFRPLPIRNLTPPSPPPAPPQPPPAVIEEAPPPLPKQVSSSEQAQATIAPNSGKPAALDVEAFAARVAEVIMAASPAATPTVPADQQGEQVRQALEEVGRKIDRLSVAGPGVSSVTTAPSSDYGKADDFYIPDIRVDDMLNHISLEARSLGQGGNVTSAIAALKGLHKKTQQ